MYCELSKRCKPRRIAQKQNKQTKKNLKKTTSKFPREWTLWNLFCGSVVTVHMNAVFWICETNDCFLLINAGAVVKHKIYQNIKFWLSYLSGNPWLNSTFSFSPCIIYCFISKHNMQLLKIIIKQNTSIYIVLAQ